MLDYIINTLQNPYISGIIVFAVTWPLNNWLTKKANRTEYYKKVSNSNSDIIDILSDYVISFRDIDKDTVNEIINATSIESNINIKDLYGINEIKSILIKKIISMKILESEQKSSIIKLIKDNLKYTDLADETVKINIDNSFNKKLRVETSILTTMLTLIGALITIIFSLIQKSNEYFGIYNSFDSTLIVYLAMGMFIILIEIIILFLLKNYRNEKRKREKANNNDKCE
ncbi:hypothetical protein ACV3ZD_04960 [Clostridium perfringens]|uniref:hypothetical protein n=1 Tax=Clostridium perfringens TaxID=1502 RepID=UPI0018D74AE3|nr:hypothetical protein [Clostridium perfringens]ELC8464948.1 hypothetical protein [Clostridium perfringens]MCR1963670.1 hypothetical protein [Clostridium perfringens]QPR51101.1 hypothetical protein I6G88_13565 [Clostridium perfringens]